MQQPRQLLPVAQLYAILDREFRSKRPAACTLCAVPLPFWRQPPDDVSANWFIGTPTLCGHGCDGEILVFASYAA